MAVRPILPITDPLLRKQAKKVHRFDPALARLIADLTETLRDAGGAGLAGPQIGQLQRVFVAHFEDEDYVLVNPEIVRAEGAAYGTEGCLSLDGYVGENIRRATQVVIKYQDARGKAQRIVADDWLARIFQHEIDHLNGVLFTDHLQSPRDLRPVPKGDPAERAGAKEPARAGR